MAGKLFDITTREFREQLYQKNPNGGRFRYPPRFSNHNPDFRENRNKQICEKRNEGLSLREISEEFNLGRTTIKKILKNNGMSFIPEKKAESRIERIKLMLKTGMNKRQIAKREGISRTRLYQILNEIKKNEKIH